MNAFSENYCRLCTEVFCCKNCRLEHEQNHHNVFPECGICIYGKVLLKKPSDNLLKHLSETHLPLHCLYCEKVFLLIEELMLHSTCVQRQKQCNQENCNMVITPTSAAESNYDSPPVTSIMYKSILTSSNKNFAGPNSTISLTTSTPMQRSNEREILQDIPEVITPVDYPESTNISSKFKSANITKSVETPGTFEQSENTEPPLKRRVTFNETPIISFHTTGHYKRTKNELLQEENNSSSTGGKFSKINEHDTSPRNRSSDVEMDFNNAQNEQFITANNSAENIKTDMFTTAAQLHVEEILKNKIIRTPQAKSLPSHDETNTEIWESALMDSISSKSDILSPILHSNLIETNTDSPVTEQNLEISSLQIESYFIKSEIVPPTADEYSTNTDITSPTATKNFIPHTPSPAIASTSTKTGISSILDKSLTKVQQLIPTINQNFIKVDIHLPIINVNVTESEQSLPEDVNNTKNFSVDPAPSDQTCEIQNTMQNSDLQKHGIWSSMASIVKTVVQGLAGLPHVSHDSRDNIKICKERHKRCKPESDISAEESPVRKKIKLMDIRCRRTIRDIQPLQCIRYSKKNVKDKWTQTD